MSDGLLVDFPSDGCTLWPETWRGIDLHDCCVAHDFALAGTYDLGAFIRGNLELFHCVASAGAWDAAVLMAIGVSTPVALGFFFFGRKPRSRA